MKKYISILMLIIVGWLFFDLIHSQMKKKTDARQEIMYMYHALSPGMSMSDVRRIFELNKFKHIRLVNTENDEIWSLITDMYLLVFQNWIINLYFTDDGSLDTIRVTTYDGKPGSAPPDKTLKPIH